MTGANYMGGKRNSAKARSKDAARLHKSHFSRQRLGILVTGLGPRTNNEVESISHTAGPRDISLRQAKADLLSSPSVFQESFVEPAAQPRSTPRTVSINSKVLETIQMNEPLYFRSQVEKILAIPDLLGLRPRNSAVRTSVLLPPNSPEPFTFPLPSLGSSPSKKRRIYKEESSYGPSLSGAYTHMFPESATTPIRRIEMYTQRRITPIQRLFSRDRARRQKGSSSEGVSLQASPIGPFKSDRRPQHITCTHERFHRNRQLRPTSRDTPNRQYLSSFTSATSDSSPPTQDTPIDLGPKTHFRDGLTLLESLQKSSDPWALIGWELLDLETPPSSARLDIRAQDAELLESSRSKRGVGFVPDGDYTDELTSVALGNSPLNNNQAIQDEIYLNFESSQREKSLSDSVYHQVTPPRKTLKLPKRAFHSDHDNFGDSSPPSGLTQLASGTSYEWLHYSRDESSLRERGLTKRVGGENRPLEITPQLALKDTHQDDSGYGPETLVVSETLPLDFLASHYTLSHGSDDALAFDDFASRVGANFTDDFCYQDETGTGFQSFSPNQLNVPLSLGSIETSIPINSRTLIALDPGQQKQTRSLRLTRDFAPTTPSNEILLNEPSKQEPGPTDSQLLAMYTNQDGARELGVGSSLGSLGNTMEGVSDEKRLEDDDAEDAYSGPCLFAD